MLGAGAVVSGLGVAEAGGNDLDGLDRLGPDLLHHHRINDLVVLEEVVEEEAAAAAVAVVLVGAEEAGHVDHVADDDVRARRDLGVRAATVDDEAHRGVVLADHPEVATGAIRVRVRVVDAHDDHVLELELLTEALAVAGLLDRRDLGLTVPREARAALGELGLPRVARGGLATVGAGVRSGVGPRHRCLRPRHRRPRSPRRDPCRHRGRHRRSGPPRARRRREASGTGAWRISLGSLRGARRPLQQRSPLGPPCETRRLIPAACRDLQTRNCDRAVPR